MNKQRTFVLGDVHGGFKSLRQCFERSNFSYGKDRLICLGDIVDGWPETKQCIDELLKIKNLTLLSGNHDCLSMDTEVLTKRGWLKYNEILKDDKILSLDIKTNIGIWTDINKIIIKDFYGLLNNVITENIDLLCTDNHRILHKGRLDAKKNIFSSFQYKKFYELKRRTRIPTNPSYSNIVDIDITDDQLRLVAWLLTDGWVTITNRHKHIHYHSIGQSKIKTTKHIKQLLKRLGYKYTFSTTNKKVDFICGKKVKHQLPSNNFRILQPYNSKIMEFFPQKYPFPSSLFQISKRQFDFFLKELILANGSFYSHTKNAWILYGEKEFLNNVQILCLMNGYRASLVKDNRGDPRLNISIAHFSDYDPYIKNKKIKYKGKVWCLSVPYTNFMVRRNGKHFFTGNCWFLDYCLTSNKEYLWLTQGGYNTLKSYEGSVPKSHIEFLLKAKLYHVENNILFVHGGIIPGSKVENNTKDTILWDRELICNAYKKCQNRPNYRMQNIYDEIFVGHTTTGHFNKEFKPIRAGEVTCVDTGGGWEGKLTIMDIETREYWQSDFVKTLYPDSSARKDYTNLEFYSKLFHQHP